MSRYISETLRAFVAERAAHRCEYCRIPERFSNFRFQVDHIISRKHRGATKADNLAYTCPLCNGSKGSDLGTFLTGQKRLVRFFNPRTDNWFDHFEAKNGVIFAKTRVGAATVKILGLNYADDVVQRQLLTSIGLWP